MFFQLLKVFNCLTRSIVQMLFGKTLDEMWKNGGMKARGIDEGPPLTDTTARLHGNTALFLQRNGQLRESFPGHILRIAKYKKSMRIERPDKRLKLVNLACT